MAKYRSHKSGVYGAHLHVATTREQLAALLRRFNLAEPESLGASYLTVDTSANNTPHLTVWIDVSALDGPGLIDYLAHEAVHTAAQLLDHIGQDTKRHDSEALAYLTGWVAARIWESIP